MACCGGAPKEEAPMYDDGPTCPYSVKPSALFAINEVRRGPGPSGCHVKLPLVRGAPLRPLAPPRTLQAKDTEALRGLGGAGGLADAICSHLHDGLDPVAPAGAPGSPAEHARVFGTNTYKQTPAKNFFALCYENIQDPIILLLIVAALVRAAHAGRSQAAGRSRASSSALLQPPPARAQESCSAACCLGVGPLGQLAAALTSARRR